MRKSDVLKPLMDRDFNVEDLGAEELEYLKQIPNEQIFYIPNRAIIVDEDGKYFWTTISEDEKEFFFLHEPMLKKYLFDYELLQDREKGLIDDLKEYDERFFAPYDLHLVELKHDEDKISFVFAHNKTEDCYYEISRDDIHYVNENLSDELLHYQDEERSLAHPMQITYQDDEMLCC